MKDGKIIIALSGGVDSAVSAALLKKQGFDVSGVFFLFFKGKSAKASEKKAREVARVLEIPLKVLDFSQQFRRKVIDCFIEFYKKGLTPNPCVGCNKEMKFRLLFEILKKEKADFVATGHYAIVEPVIASGAKQSHAYRDCSGLLRRCAPRNDKFKLFKAKDKLKDQSYFLYRLTQKDLQRTIFPLGEYKKSDVKKLAKKLNLPVLGDEESQDICFLAGNDVNSFLKKNIKFRPGDIVDEDGNVLGRHKGLPLYTIGQRKGIEIGPPTSRREREAIRASGPGPFYVIGKNSRKNELRVSKNEKTLLVKKFKLRGVNWIITGIDFPLRAKVQIRYHSAKIPAIIRRGKRGIFEIETGKPLRAVTPGQSAVFYLGDEVLGGGIII